MRLTALLALAAMFPAVFMTGRTTSLSNLRDTSRVLLIFAASASDPRIKLQLEMLHAHDAEFRERDVVAIAVPEHGATATEATLSAAEAVSTRKQFQAETGEFLVVLIGKDGGEKLRSRQPIPFEKLRATIDAMPMRQEEMNKRRSK